MSVRIRLFSGEEILYFFNLSRNAFTCHKEYIRYLVLQEMGFDPLAQESSNLYVRLIKNKRKDERLMREAYWAMADQHFREEELETNLERALTDPSWEWYHIIRTCADSHVIFKQDDVYYAVIECKPIE